MDGAGDLIDVGILAEPKLLLRLGNLVLLHQLFLEELKLW
jgi:hypothetical protein